MIKYLLFFSSAILISLSSCKDKCEEAGTGGDFTIAAFPMHHDVHIISEALPGYPDSAWIKFNTDLFPGEDPSAYDLILVGEASEDHIHIEGLKCGLYYIYMTGWDVDINQRVKGGVPYHIHEDAPSETDLDVPVSE